MLPPKTTASPQQQRLLKLFKTLADVDRQQLLSFAEFLVFRAQHADTAPEADSDAQVTQPLDIPRPASESVVAAIRRLSRTFPMLDREPLLHETSALMTAHVMQGRAAADVIDELEQVFQRHYDRFAGGNE